MKIIYSHFKDNQYCYLTETETKKFLTLFPETVIDSENLTIKLSPTDLNKVYFDLTLPTYLTIDGIMYEVEIDFNVKYNPNINIDKILPFDNIPADIKKKKSPALKTPSRSLKTSTAEKDFECSMVLMNKDIPISSFTLILYKYKDGRYNDIFPKFSVTNVKKLSSKIKFGQKNISDFLKRRTPYKHRAHIKQLMKISQVYNIYGLIQYTHLAGLNDTFWVKPTDSPLTWQDVSLYENDFDEVIAKTAFDGGMYGQGLSKTTPELSTNGTFPKCWIRNENGDIFLKKAGGITGTEPYSEYYVQQILEALDLPYVKYTLHKDEYLYTTCRLFTSDDVGYLPFGQIFQGYFEDILAYITELGVRENFCNMLIADTVMMNEDRHLGNFGFLIKNAANEIIDYAPLFDHNLSLMWGDPKPSLNSLKFKGHKISDNPEDTFIDIISFDMISTKMRRKLAAMRGFKLTKHPEYNLPDEKLDALNNLINHQINSLLAIR